MTRGMTPSPHQLKAIKLAVPSGYLRRLPRVAGRIAGILRGGGGYWVGDETPWRGNQGVIDCPIEQWVGTQTVHACNARGWIEIGDYLARLTESGRAHAELDNIVARIRRGPETMTERTPMPYDDCPTCAEPGECVSTWPTVLRCGRCGCRWDNYLNVLAAGRQPTGGEESKR